MQKEQTAYEILGVGRGATHADVQTAFAARLTSGISVQKLTAAKRVLQSPNERALVDLFHYLPEWAGDLVPSVIQQPIVLDVARRGSTAQSWENQLRTGFPDLGAAHSLAVLWYWWALHEEDQMVGAKKARAIPADQMWQKAIASWSMVLSSEDFWSMTGGIGGETRAQVSSAIIDRLTGRLHESAQRYSGNHSAELVARYQELEFALSTELRTAKLVSASGIRMGHKKIGCGVLMLQQVELFESVKGQVAAGIKKSPSSENLKKLGNALSAFASIAVLIDANKPQTALDALDALPRKDQEDAEVRALRARALHTLAQQQASLSNFDEALEIWERALKLQLTTELRASIISAIVSSCRTRAAELQRQPDQAIALLDKGQKLSDSPELRLLLAELLTNRGIKAINDAQNRVKSEGPNQAEKAKRDLKKGLDDLGRAAQFGGRRASEQLGAAKDLYEQFCAQVDSGFIFLAPEVAELLAEANHAEGSGDLDRAINLLRQAENVGTERSHGIVQKQLAFFLSQRAVQKVNCAMESYAKVAEERRRRAVRRFYLWKFSFPDWFVNTWHSNIWIACGPMYAFSQVKSMSVAEQVLWGLVANLAWLMLLIVGNKRWRSSRYMRLCDVCNSGAAYEMNLPGRGGGSLCEGHAKSVQELLVKSAPDKATENVLKWALQSLQEANALDLGSERIRENLATVQRLQNDLVG